MLQAEAGGHEVLLVRHRGEIRALGATCPHHGAPLVDGLLHDGRVVCPWHQAAFRVTDGDLLEPPALECLPSYEVEVEGGEVWVTVPEAASPSRRPAMADADPSADGRVAVVVGGGSAGLAAVQEMRRVGYRGRLVMITADEQAPYDRTNCSKAYLAGEAPAEWLPLKDAGFFAEAAVERVVTTLSEIDLRARVLTLPGGATIRADELLIATGGEPRRLEVPGAAADGVLTLRTWRDADAIIDAVDEETPVVVVGAGFIGLEVAASLRQRGVASVTVVAPEAVPLQHALGGRTGAWLHSVHERHGVRFAGGRSVTGLETEDGAVRAVLLDDGTRLAAGLVVVGIGIRPATGAVRGVELQADGSVATDDHLRVCDHVWAAGDIATFPDWRTGAPTRVEHWRTAAQQGMVAGRNMAGVDTPYRSVPFFWTMQHGTTLGYVGHAPRWDEEIVHGDVEGGDFLLYYVCEGRVLGVAGAGERSRWLPTVHELMRLGGMPGPRTLREGTVELDSLLAAATS